MLLGRSVGRRRFVPLMLAMLAVVFLLTASHPPSSMVETASANGATRLIIDDARSGPYLLRVGILPGSPKVGTLHGSVLVQDASG